MKRKIFSFKTIHHVLFIEIKRLITHASLFFLTKNQKSISSLEKYDFIFHNRFSLTIRVALNVLSPKSFSKRDSTIPMVKKEFKTQYIIYPYICELKLTKQNLPLKK